MNINSGGLAIIHTISPQSIIEVKKGDAFLAAKNARVFSYISTSGTEEKFTLILKHSFFESKPENTEAEINHLLKRAWRWFQSYLAWEDDNIDLEDYGNKN